MPNSSRMRGGSKAKPGRVSRSIAAPGISGNGGRTMDGASRCATSLTLIGPSGDSIHFQYACSAGQSTGLKSRPMPSLTPTRRASCQNCSFSAAASGRTQRWYASTLVTINVACTHSSNSGSIAR
jgi:hypothetical protein